MTLTRREVLGAVGIAAGSCALSSCAMEGMGSFQGGTGKKVFPWKYTELDPDITARRAYYYYDKGHCMYAAFAPAISQLADKYGEPYRSFPVEMMRYGAGGVAGWGSLCGAVNGSAALMSLFVKKEDELKQLVDELFLWYQQTELPQYVPQKPALKIEIAKSVSNSVLCHVSVTRWCKVSGHKTFTKPQKERCKRLSAETAKKTVEILNAHFASRFSAARKHNEKTQQCRSCHTKGSELQNTRGKMSCTSCHSSIADDHGLI
ncbi:MAG: C_GCAxxG_C_C family protein [Planctomycetes bacterium]|nr:C_GCAxxG_C_C family protein [Planctomycetota bacterium]